MSQAFGVVLPRTVGFLFIVASTASFQLVFDACTGVGFASEIIGLDRLCCNATKGRFLPTVALDSEGFSFCAMLTLVGSIVALVGTTVQFDRFSWDDSSIRRLVVSNGG